MLAASIASIGLFTFGPSPVLAGTQMVSESFTNSTLATAADWAMPSAASGNTNAACLTASGSTTTPIPDCTTSGGDSNGNGTLELTSDTGGEEGGVAYSVSVPTTDGIDAIFDTYQYGGNAADGIAFFLAAANPSNPKPPAAIGQPGGALGYSGFTKSGKSNNGMTDAYLAFGFDAYGNFANSTYEGSGCTSPGWRSSGSLYPENVTVRGPGNNTSGYCLLTSTAGSGSTASSHSWMITGGASGTRSTSMIPVEVVINPSSSAITTTSGLDVAAMSFMVAFTPLDNSGHQVSLQGALPSTTGSGNDALTSSEVPSSWINSTTGIPDQLTFGWVGSTGGNYDYHLVNQVQTSTVSGDPPALSASVTDTASGHPTHGSTMDYDVTVGDGSTAGAEDDPITATDTLPSGTTAIDTGSNWSGGTGWTCGTSGQTVTCTDGSNDLAAGGSTSITIPVTVTGIGGTTLTDSVTVSSEDASAAAATDTAKVAANATSITASASPTTTTYGNGVTLSASGLPSEATGTVTFTSGSTTLCTATVDSGSASCSTGVQPAGSYASVTAAYSGDTNYGSSTATTSFTISQATTSLTASASPTTTTYGNTVTLAASGLPSAATGSVTFTAGGTTLCSGTVGSGHASCATGALPAASYAVTATYPGDGNYTGSTAATSFTISKASTSMTAEASPGSTAQGNQVTLSTSGLPADATGSVTFTTGGTTWCSATVSSGDASCTTTTAPGVGSHSVTATYGGDSNHATSTATTSFTVTSVPVLQISTPGTPTGAAAGTSYTLTLSPSLGSSGGPAYHDPGLTADLPAGETFSAAPSLAGWDCSLSESGTLLSCTSTAAPPITAGMTLANITATVDISASSLGSLQTAATLEDSADQATEATASAPVDVTSDPVFSLTTSGTPSAAAAGSTYTLRLNPSLGEGSAYTNPTLTATLPSGEMFGAAPSAAGWDCSVSTAHTILTCTSTLAPIPLGAPLGDLSVAVLIGGSASGNLEMTASLSDSADLGTTADASATVDVTATPVLQVTTSGTPSGAAAGSSYSLTLSPSVGSAGGSAYNDPTLYATLLSGESFDAVPTASGWSCSLNVDSTVLTCTASTAPISAGTALTDVVATVDVGTSASGSLLTLAALADSPDDATTATATASVTATAVPVLQVTTLGTPSGAVARTDYTLTLAPSLSSSGGPAYSTLTLSATLPSGETFSTPASTGEWTCGLDTETTTVTCTVTPASPVAAGTSLDDVGVPVAIASAARGQLQTQAALADPADAATTAHATATVDITLPPQLYIASDTTSQAVAGTIYALILDPSLRSSGGPTYSNPEMFVRLPAGETFAAVPSSSTGWSCEVTDSATVLACTYTSSSIAPGDSLGTLTAGVLVATSTSGLLRTYALIQDSEDNAASMGLMINVNVTPPPVLDLSLTAPAAAAAGASYDVTVNAAVDASAGPADSNPTLVVSLPADETFETAPTATGWTCSLNGDSSALTCFSTTAPIPAGTSLTPITATVDLGGSALGTLDVTAALTDTQDLAPEADAGAGVDVTADPALQLTTSGTPTGAATSTSYTLTLFPALGPTPAGPAYSDPILTAILPGGETFQTAPTPAGWRCSLRTADSVLSCLASGAPVEAGTSLTAVSATVIISASATGSLETVATLADSADAATTATSEAQVTVTAPPCLILTTSGPPTTANQGSSFTDQVAVQLSPTAGPAYNPPTLSITLASGESFMAAPAVSGWALSMNGDSALTGTWTGPTPIDPGTEIANFSIQVKVAGTASGDLAATVSTGDSADGAATTADTGMTTVPVAPPHAGAGRVPLPWGTSLLLIGLGLLLIGWEVRRRPSPASRI